MAENKNIDLIELDNILYDLEIKSKAIDLIKDELTNYHYSITKELHKYVKNDITDSYIRFDMLDIYIEKIQEKVKEAQNLINPCDKRP